MLIVELTERELEPLSQIAGDDLIGLLDAGELFLTEIGVYECFFHTKFLPSEPNSLTPSSGNLFVIGSRSTHWTPWPSFSCFMGASFFCLRLTPPATRRTWALAICRHLRPAFRRVALLEIPCWWLEGIRH